MLLTLATFMAPWTTLFQKMFQVKTFLGTSHLLYLFWSFSVSSQQAALSMFLSSRNPYIHMYWKAWSASPLLFFLDSLWCTTQGKSRYVDELRELHAGPVVDLIVNQNHLISSYPYYSDWKNWPDSSNLWCNLRHKSGWSVDSVW